MKINKSLLLIIITGVSISLNTINTPIEIIKKSIDNIDTINTIYYKQDLIRTNPGNTDETIRRYREMYFKRLIEDSIVGVKGHWYMYINDKENVIYEDIFDGDRLVRKNNSDSTARIYDLIKYPEFKDKPFWSHNTPFSLQFMLKYILANSEYYQIEQYNDTVIQNTDCFQICIYLENMETMPGFMSKLEEREGGMSATYIFIDKLNYFPVSLRIENASTDNPDQPVFIDQIYYDLKFNLDLDTLKLFNTSDDILKGYQVDEIKP